MDGEAFLAWCELMLVPILRPGDIVMSIKGSKVTTLSSLFRTIWSVGPAGADIPMMIFRDGSTFELGVTSADRNSFLKGPVLH